MFNISDLRQVARHQEALRFEAEQRRLAAGVDEKEHRTDRARRALRLRLSVAA